MNQIRWETTNQLSTCFRKGIFVVIQVKQLRIFQMFQRIALISRCVGTVRSQVFIEEDTCIWKGGKQKRTENRVELVVISMNSWLLKHVCVYMCIHLYMYTYTYIHLSVYMHVCIHMHFLSYEAQKQTFQLQ